MLRHLIDAYVTLLKVDHMTVRISLQPTYCLLRDRIAFEVNADQQFIQEKYEEISLLEEEKDKGNLRYLSNPNFLNFINETFPGERDFKFLWTKYKYDFIKL